MAHRARGLLETLVSIPMASRVPEPLPPDHVLLPWHTQGHPRTELNRKCAAVCAWVARIRHTDIRDIAILSIQEWTVGWDPFHATG
jgi:hypothetical protein